LWAFGFDLVEAQADLPQDVVLLWQNWRPVLTLATARFREYHQNKNWLTVPAHVGQLLTYFPRVCPKCGCEYVPAGSGYCPKCGKGKGQAQISRLARAVRRVEGGDVEFLEAARAARIADIKMLLNLIRAQCPGSPLKRKKKS